MTVSNRKICSKCRKEKLLTQFYEDKDSRDGYYTFCIECSKKYQRKYYIKNKERIKEKVKNYKNNNKDKFKLIDKEYREKNKDQAKLYAKKYYKENIEKMKKRSKEWKLNNVERVKLNARKHNRKRRQNITVKLSDAMASNIYDSLKGNKNGRGWETLVGYTLENLRKHLELSFTPKMSWKNYGRHGWNIDHVRPISSFNFKNTEDKEFKECWALNNLQPLWETTRIINGIEYIGNINKGQKLINSRGEINAR